MTWIFQSSGTLQYSGCDTDMMSFVTRTSISTHNTLLYTERNFLWVAFPQRRNPHLNLTTSTRSSLWSLWSRSGGFSCSLKFARKIWLKNLSTSLCTTIMYLFKHRHHICMVLLSSVMMLAWKYWANKILSLDKNMINKNDNGQTLTSRNETDLVLT